MGGHTEAGHYQLSHLEALEAQSVHIMREVVAEFERPVLLFSGGKDSVVMLRLAEKAFWPARLPFPVMHVDTGHNFPEVLEFRIVAWPSSTPSSRWLRSRNRSTAAGWSRTPAPTPRATACRPGRCSTPSPSTASMPSSGEHAATRRRPGPKSASYSFRDEFGQWDPKNQRPELWGLFNGRHRTGEHIRVFPLSDWTELDIWQYIAQEAIEVPSIYFSHRRTVFRRDGMLRR